MTLHSFGLQNFFVHLWHMPRLSCPNWVLVRPPVWNQTIPKAPKFPPKLSHGCLNPCCCGVLPQVSVAEAADQSGRVPDGPLSARAVASPCRAGGSASLSKWRRAKPAPVTDKHEHSSGGSGAQRASAGSGQDISATMDSFLPAKRSQGYLVSHARDVRRGLLAYFIQLIDSPEEKTRLRRNAFILSSSDFTMGSLFSCSECPHLFMQDHIATSLVSMYRYGPCFGSSKHVCFGSSNMFATLFKLT